MQYCALHIGNTMLIMIIARDKSPDHEEDEKMTNKRLEKLQPLRHRVAVYVPGTNGVNTAADNSEYVRRAAALLSDAFGGATATPARGFWMSESAGLVEERVTIVYAYAGNEALEDQLGAVIEFCEGMKEALKQEAISLELDSALYFI